MPITEKQVLEALSHVEEPDLKKDLVTLNMVKDVAIDRKKVAFTVILTTPACPLKDVIRKACETAIQTIVDPEAQVEIHMTAEVTEDKEQSGPQLPGVKNVVVVASGKGGVGKSTVAANLAIALAQSGAKTGLVDADIYGPSVPTLFGLEGERPRLEEVNGKEQMLPFERHGVKVNSIGFLVPPGQAVVWRGPMASNALKQLFTDTHWGELDYLIVDLPPGTGDIHITIAQQFPVNGAVMVTTPQNVALSDVRKAIAMFVAPQINVPILGLVENMAWFETDELPGRKFFLFGEGGGQTLAEEYNVELLGQIPIEESIRQSGDDGSPAAMQTETPSFRAFSELAAAVAQQISIRNAHLAAQPSVG